MSFFISDAMAEGAAAASTQESLMGMLPLIVLFVVFYFLLIRPQMKRTKEHKSLVAALAKNDEVATSGGFLGKITKVEESIVVLQIADGVEVRMQRSAITNLMPKGTVKFK
ncbi:MAG: preprotein translocase subunit YajC [Gammaproteobacteria bacterium]|nr:preprotein translocase subunit YajC [Gammaproteobacteria bacterium]